MNDLANRISLAAQIIKVTLECFDLYLGMDAKTEDFIFCDRKGFDDRTGKFGRVNSREINIRRDK